MNRIITLLIFSFCLLWPATGWAQDNWELKKNENGIAVYTRKVKDEKLKEIRVVTELACTTAQLINVLQDINNYNKWVYFNKKTSLLKKTNESLIYYTETEAPWPVTGRDLILELIIREVPGTQNLDIKVRSRPDYLPPKKDLVRVPYSLATWKVVPIAPNRLKVDYTFSVNPGGSIPTWLVNMAATVGPYNSFVNLKKLLAEGKF